MFGPDAARVDLADVHGRVRCAAPPPSSSPPSSHSARRRPPPTESDGPTTRLRRAVADDRTTTTPTPTPTATPRAADPTARATPTARRLARRQRLGQRVRRRLEQRRLLRRGGRVRPEPVRRPWSAQQQPSRCRGRRASSPWPPGHRRDEPPAGPDASPEPVGRVIPTWTEPLAAAASRVVGGPLGAARGRRAQPVLDAAARGAARSPSPSWRSAGWEVAVPAAVQDGRRARAGLAQQPPVRGDVLLGHHSALRHRAPRQRSRAVPRLVGAGPGHATEQVRYMEYPVLTGFFQYANARLAAGMARDWSRSTPWLPSALRSSSTSPSPRSGWRSAWLVSVWAVCRLPARAAVGRRARRAAPRWWWCTCSPTSTARRRVRGAALLALPGAGPVLAGVLLGLGGAAKLYPLLLLLPLLVLCWRCAGATWPGGGHRRWRRSVTWAVVNLPVALAWTAGWWEFFQLNRERARRPRLALVRRLLLHRLARVRRRARRRRGPDAAQRRRSPRCSSRRAPAWPCSCAAAPRPPRLAQLAFLVVAAFLLVNKVWSPQYSLWLVPLAVLALPRWRLLLAWMTPTPGLGAADVVLPRARGARASAARLVLRRRRCPRRRGGGADRAGGAERPAAGRRTRSARPVTPGWRRVDDPEWPARRARAPAHRRPPPVLSPSAPR